MSNPITWYPDGAKVESDERLPGVTIGRRLSDCWLPLFSARVSVAEGVSRDGEIS
jgi:hypothetical protein